MKRKKDTQTTEAAGASESERQLAASNGSATAEVEKCAICGKPLYGAGIGSWIDDEEYGDVHEACL